MPGLDGTGPWGEGARTGGGRGRCAPVTGEVGSTVSGGGLGRRMGGRGLGRGRGNCFRSVRGLGQDQVSELSELQEKFNRLQADLEAIKAKGQ